MDNTFTQTAPMSDAEYGIEFEAVMAEIRQYAAAFDQTQAEIEAMQAAAERKATRSDALTEEINRMVKTLWGPK